LISYWLGPVTVIENYRTRKKVAGAGFVADVLSYCEKPRTLAKVCANFAQTNPRVVRQTLRAMAKYGLLEVPTGQATKMDKRWDGWKAWRPGASYFHFSTKDVPYARGEAEDFRRLKRLAEKSPLPPRKKAAKGVKIVALSRARQESEFVRVLTERRTWREFARQPLERAQLEQLLGLSFGVQGWAAIPGVGRLALKSSPSGGALHPLEAYVMIQKVRGVGAGIYRYDDEGHRLELVRSGRTKKAELSRLLAGLAWFCDAAVLVFLTAVFSRSQWKYDNARAYRVVLAEAGHVCQTFCLTATWLGLAPFCTMAFADSPIEKALGVDGVEESVVYAMGVGPRPGRAATAERLRITRDSK
jgi:SagB-type dehydrogenase family enzyme